MPPLPWFARSHMRLLCKTRRRSRLARAAREARAKKKDTGLYRFIFINVGPCRGLFLESPGNFSGPESCFVFAVFAFKFKLSKILKLIQWNYQLNNNEAKLTGLRARNCATIQKVWILKFAFGTEKFPGLSRNGPLSTRIRICLKPHFFPQINLLFTWNQCARTPKRRFS